MKTPEDAADLPTEGLYDFANFRLDARNHLLFRHDGSRVPLTPKVFDTLLVLVHHAGTVLTKNRLMEAVWPDTVVEENNLSQNISALRRILGETPGANRFIGTVPGRGYRFVAPVRSVAGNEAVLPPLDGTSPPLGLSPALAHVAEPATARWRFLRPVAAVALALCAVIGLFSWRSAAPSRPSVTPSRENGVAVLPFENLNRDGSDEFFVNGIHDDILASVAKIKDLKVIARASVMDYRGPRLAGRVRLIGNSLGVSHVLEGSVRRESDRVVVNAALIDTKNERRVWSERYERTLTDSLSLQGELALEIARELRATLTAREAAVAAVKPTENQEAYLLYLRARELEIRSFVGGEVLPAISLYQQAVDLDPRFALARARLSLCASQLFNTADWPEGKIKARLEADEALRLQPALGEAHLALSHCYLWLDGDYDRALREVERTAEFLPNSAEVPLTAAFIYKRQNRYRERLAALHRAEVLDPRNIRVLALLTFTSRWLRAWPEALHRSDRVAAIDDHDEGRQWRRASDEFRMRGDIAVLNKAIAREAAAPLPLAADLLAAMRYDTAMLERDYSTAARHLAATVDAISPEPHAPFIAHCLPFHQALIAVASGADPATRQAALEAARVAIETRLTSDPAAAGDSHAHADLGLLYAFLGRKEDAIRACQHAIELTLPGGIEANDLSAALAMVYAQTGEPGKAIDLIERLLTVPTELQRGAIYNMTLVDLRFRWQWDPLRSDPRFQKLLAGPEPTTIL